jgi:cobalt/nickel transport system permease protein
MAKMEKTLYNFSLLEELSRRHSAAHDIHPLSTLLCTLVYIGVVASFGRYEIIRLIPFLLYPVFVFSIGQIPFLPMLKRSLVVLPIILGVGIFALFFDKSTVVIAGMPVYGGAANLVSLLIKYALTVLSALLLIAVTGMNKLAYAMRLLRLPRLLVLQITLTYRYLTVLTEEVVHTTRAYALRAPGQKGVKANAWGPLAGHVLLRTFDRAQYVYRAMCLRGFDGDYRMAQTKGFTGRDAAYLFSWTAFFIAARVFDLPYLLGSAFGGIL